MTQKLYSVNVKDFDSRFVAIICIVCAFIFLWIYKRRSKLNLPPGPIGLPIVGYLPFLGPEPFRKLHSLRKKYGNVYSVYFGRTLVIMLDDFESVKEAFSKSTTIDRPEELFSFIPGGVGFSSVNGHEWFEQRRFSVRTMGKLGIGKGSWEVLILEEVNDFINEIHESRGQPMDICKLLTSSISNNVASLVLGKRFSYDDPKRDFLNRSIDAASQFFAQAGFQTYFPKLFQILVKLGIGNFKEKQDKLLAFNTFMKDEIKTHEKNPNPAHQEDFINNYYKEMKAQKEHNPHTTFNEINLCGNATALLVGASDTTRTSLNWILLAMAAYPEIQTKVHEELDSVLGRNRQVTWEERLRLPYTYAVTMEGQRWKTVAPLNTSRIAQEDIKIAGYDIPKGASIIANLWSLHNDVNYWNDPESFIPERFLKNGGKEIISKPDSYLPFSYGKRNCPGETIAMMEIFLYFVALMQNFKVMAPTDEGVKLDAILGLTYQAVKQDLRLISRS